MPIPLLNKYYKLGLPFEGRATEGRKMKELKEVEQYEKYLDYKTLMVMTQSWWNKYWINKRINQNWKRTLKHFQVQVYEKTQRSKKVQIFSNKTYESIRLMNQYICCNIKITQKETP